MEQAFDIVSTASLVADASRLAMLMTLLDGRAYTANELARSAHITPQTTSFHLDKLVGAGLLEPMREGRHRYFRLAGPQVAHTLEALLALHHPSPYRPATSCPEHLREARSCYDHIAGRLGVRLYRGITARGWTGHADEGLIVNPSAAGALAELGFAEADFPVAARPCLDWSEREHHFAGEFGRRLMQAMLTRRWLLRGKSRRLTLTGEGGRQLAAWGI